MALTAEELEVILRLKDELSGKLQTSQNNLESFGAAATKVGAGLTAGVTLPIIGIGGAALKLGIDAVESEDLFKRAFGGMEQSARKWSEDLNERLGLNSYQLRESSSLLNLMFGSMKIGEQASYDMSTSLTELAVDMGSAFNLDIVDAMDKIRAGITGETEPLKRLGILLDEDTVKRFAQEKGLIKVGQEMTAQQKVLARYMSIMEQTGAIHNNFADTIESPANQLRQMREEITKAATDLGMALLPAFQQLLPVMKDGVVVIQDAVKWFSELSPTGQKVVITIAGIAAAAGPLLVAFGAMAASISAIVALGPALSAFWVAATGPIGLAVVAITALTTAWMVWGDDIKRITADVFNAVKGWFVDKFNAIVGGVKGSLEKVNAAFTWLYDTLVGHSTVPDMVNGIHAEFDRMGGGMSEKSKKAAAKVSENFEEMKRRATNLVEEMHIEEIARQQAFLKDLAEKDRVGRQLMLDERDRQAVEAVTKADEAAKLYLSRELALHNEQLQLEREYWKVLSSVRNAEGLRLMEEDKKRMQGWAGQTFDFLKDLTTNTSKTLGGMQEKLSGTFSQLFGGGKDGGVIHSIMSTGLNAIFGPASGLISSLVSKGMAEMGKLVMAGLKKVGGFFKDLFGGPSAQELGGREVAEAFRDNLRGMLNEAQRAEAGVSAWAQAFIPLRDQIIATGASEQQALELMDRLWKAEQRGAGAVKEVIAEIERLFASGLTPAIDEATLSGDELNRTLGQPVTKVVSIQVQGALDMLGQITSGDSSRGGYTVGSFQHYATDPARFAEDFLRRNPGDEHRLADALADEHRKQEAMNNVPGRAHGGDVPSTGLMFLHQGEYVETAQQRAGERSQWTAVIAELRAINQMLRTLPAQTASAAVLAQR